ncbi:MAG: aminodeoxychorismate synthase component I [Cycloclasticus sp.]|nr:aminodeoxychorismate synthase component I [Cycloclasticus sp.]MBQ0790264.1 aminodeoxychorismate synthase component I [Cycloclasticus sp.]
MALAIKDHGGFSSFKIPYETDLLDFHAYRPERYPFLLESHQLHQPNEGADILFAFPGQSIDLTTITNNNFFSELDQQFTTVNKQHDLPSGSSYPFTGGWFAFLSYELVAAIENKLAAIQVDTRLPIASVVRIPAAIIKNHKDKSCSIICETGQETLIRSMLDDQRLMGHSNNKHTPQVNLQEAPSELFMDGVEKIKHYLREGDTLQVNLSRQWHGELLAETNYLDVYRSLRQHNPSPFAGLARFNETVICSSSPERLIRCSGDSVQMRPIAGTRPRCDDNVLDKQLSDELLLNAKENAEHIMLIDLIRNDLGKICTTGSVHVDEKMSLESYASVHHIVSNVSGHLLDNISPSDIIKAVFPGGTITGCPKIRCMEIINELEASHRGAYTGSMGYINRNGDMDLNILIRTLTLQGNTVSFRTGAGIVADSVADSELQETRHKAKALLAALNINAD